MPKLVRHKCPCGFIPRMKSGSHICISKVVKMSSAIPDYAYACRDHSVAYDLHDLHIYMHRIYHNSYYFLTQCSIRNSGLILEIWRYTYCIGSHLYFDTMVKVCLLESQPNTRWPHHAGNGPHKLLVKTFFLHYTADRVEYGRLLSCNDAAYVVWWTILESVFFKSGNYNY